MHIIQNNPYRTLGLLVGATAAEQRRQITRLQRFLEADQEPEEGFSFPAFGDLHRTLESVNDASSKLNLDSDKMSAALFWFYNGNLITDEPAFEAIKEGDSDTAIEIWRKLAYDSDDESYNDVNQKNASAFHNLSTLYLEEYGIDADALQLKLLFLESDFFNDLKNKATDETYKISKKEIQLLFLNNITSQEEFNITEFIDIISELEFIAKDEFVNGFVQKPIEEIEKKIENAKTKRKANKANAANSGKELYDAIATDLLQLKNILGANNLKFSSISDKASDEILQCGIDNFSHYKDSSTDPGAVSMNLFKMSKILAIGNIAKQRCQENTENLQEWINDKPERDKQKKVEGDLQFITSKLESFKKLPDTVSNAKDLVDSCKPKLVNIKSVLGATDDFYLKVSSAIVSNALEMLVQSVNGKVKGLSEDPISKFAGLSLGLSLIDGTIKMALEIILKLGVFDMDLNLKSHYSKNLEGIKSLAKQLNISTLTPKETLQKELKQAESKLIKIQNTTFFDSELTIANNEMNQIKEWKFLRSQSDREKQINEQQLKISNILKKAEVEKSSQSYKQRAIINEINSKIQKAEY